MVSQKTPWIGPARWARLGGRTRRGPGAVPGGGQVGLLLRRLPPLPARRMRTPGGREEAALVMHIGLPTPYGPDRIVPLCGVPPPASAWIAHPELQRMNLPDRHYPRELYGSFFGALRNFIRPLDIVTQELYDLHHASSTTTDRATTALTRNFELHGGDQR